MSSHHIVKEKQEPALIVADINALDTEYLGQLLEWAPTIVANESSAGHLAEQGLNIDIVVTPHKAFIQQDNVTLIYQGQLPFIDTALSFLIEQGYPAANILSSNLTLTDLLPYLDLINIVVFQEGKKTYAIKSGFNKWAAADELIDCYTNNAIKTKGLKKINLHQYKTEQDGFYEIHFDESHIFIAENL
jgi:thiamine pyrophosphokinase